MPISRRVPTRGLGRCVKVVAPDGQSFTMDGLVAFLRHRNLAADGRGYDLVKARKLLLEEGIRLHRPLSCREFKALGHFQEPLIIVS